MDSAEFHQSRRPRHDPEGSSGSRSGSSRRPKKYRNRWLYGVLSFGGIVLLGLMVAIISLQVVYFAKDDEAAKELQSTNESNWKTTSNSPDIQHVSKAKTTSFTLSATPKTVPTTTFLPSPTFMQDSYPSHAEIERGERGPEGQPGIASLPVTDWDHETGLAGPPDSGRKGTESAAGPEGPPGPPESGHTFHPTMLPPTSTSRVIIGMPGNTRHAPGQSGWVTTTRSAESVSDINQHNPPAKDLSTTRPSDAKSDVTSSGHMTALDIRNVLLWLILLLFGVGVILVMCTVLFVKGYCRTICPQKGQKFLLCACCRQQQDTGHENDSRVGEETTRGRNREEIQMHHITRSHDRTHDDWRSGDRESANGTVRSSGSSIETSFQAPPPYCVAMTLPSVPNTDRSQVPNVRTIRTINPPPAEVVLPSYEDAVAEGSALPS